jgi:hypothetical protein
MIFSLKKKPIVVHAITYRPDVFTYSSIESANNFYPKWISSMPNICDSPITDFSKPIYPNHSIHPYTTIKKCVGINGLYSKGFIIPMWTDFIMDLSQEGTHSYFYEFSDSATTLVTHSDEQFNYLLPKDTLHIKIESPWAFYCDEDIKFSWNEPTWNYQLDNILDFKILPAIINFKYQVNTSINMFVKRRESSYRLSIPFGTPLAHLVPLTERKIEIKPHLVSREKYNNIRVSMGGGLQKFTGRYLMNKTILKTKKCPFNFESDV